MSDQRTDLEHIHGLLTGFSNAMLVTHVGDGRLRARPMAIVDLEDSCRLWFISSRESAKAHEIEEDTRVHVVCQNDHGAYLSLDGSAHLVDDSARVVTLWKESFRVWFPGGQDDPEIVLIAFDPEVAEFWDYKGGNKVRYLWEAARAYVRGEKPEVSDKQHGVLAL